MGEEDVLVVPLVVLVGKLDGNVSNTPVRTNELVNKSPRDRTISAWKLGGVNEVQLSVWSKEVLVQSPESIDQSNIGAWNARQVNVDVVLSVVRVAILWTLVAWETALSTLSWLAWEAWESALSTLTWESALSWLIST